LPLYDYKSTVSEVTPIAGAHVEEQKLLGGRPVISKCTSNQGCGGAGTAFPPAM